MKLNPQLRSGRIGLAFLLGTLVMVGPFAIDTMFPAFGQMRAALGVSELAIQQTLSVYLMSVALMSLVHGPLSDALGRKTVLIGGLSIFGAASLACAFCTSLTQLLIFRALQGLSAGVGMIIGRAVIRDLFEAAQAQRLMSMATMVFAIGPAIAPVLGGWLLVWSDWRGIFVFLAALGVLLAAAVMLLLDETHPKEARVALRLSSLSAGYVRILKDAHFLRLAFVGSLTFCSIFLFIASAPVIIRDFLGLGDHDFIWLFAPVIAGMTLGSLISTRLAGRFSMRQQVAWGFCLTLSSTLANLLYTLWTPQVSLPWAVLPLFFTAIGSTIAFPVLMIAMLDRQPERRGAASSAQAFVNQSCNAVIAGVVAPALYNAPSRLAAGALAAALLSLALWTWERSRQAKSPKGETQDKDAGAA